MTLGRRPGGFPEGNSILSPRSNETGGGIGAKMVEYVLGASPTAKDLDNRMRHLVSVSVNLYDSFTWLLCCIQCNNLI